MHGMERRRFLSLTAGMMVGSALGADRSPALAGPAQFALVLGGGGCRAHSHIGVIRVLEQNGLKPGLIVGTSAGSLVGGLCAAGIDADGLERYGRELGSHVLRDWAIPKLGLFGGDAIRRFVVERVGAIRIETMRTRFAAVATDLHSGALKVFDRGDLGLAVQASSSVPGFLEPVRVANRLFVDGSLASPVPVGVARRMGAKKVIAVDVTFPPEDAELNGIYDALYQGFSILTRKLALEERATADLLIAPLLPVHSDMEPATIKRLVAAGEKAAREALPGLRKLLS
jgi:NTE family protein